MNYDEAADRIEELEDNLEDTKKELLTFKEFVECLVGESPLTNNELLWMIHSRQFRKAKKLLING